MSECVAVNTSQVISYDSIQIRLRELTSRSRAEGKLCKREGIERLKSRVTNICESEMKNEVAHDAL